MIEVEQENVWWLLGISFSLLLPQLLYGCDRVVQQPKCIVCLQNDQCNRTATLRVQFKTRRIRLFGSGVCYPLAA